MFDWIIFFDLPPNDANTLTHLPCSSSGISFAPFFLALSCFWEMFQDMGSDYLPILQAVPFSPLFHSNVRSSFFNFQKACWNNFGFHFVPHSPSAKEYSFLPLCYAAALFTSLALNTAKFSIPFVKRQPQAW